MIRERKRKEGGRIGADSVTITARSALKVGDGFSQQRSSHRRGHDDPWLWANRNGTAQRGTVDGAAVVISLFLKDPGQQPLQASHLRVP